MRNLFCAMAVIVLLPCKSQLSGVLNVPFTYTSLASAINALNTQGVSAPVTVAIAAGFTETAITGGFTLTTSGSLSLPICFMKVGIGPNPIIYAYNNGNKTPGAVTQDGIWRFAGCDYITIDGIDLFDNNIQNPQTMEFGFGFFKVNGTNGCQFNTVKNCTITLNNQNNGAGTYPGGDGSRGIELVNASMSAHTTSILTTNTSGCNAGNIFKGNLILNCFTGIVLHGFADTSPYSFVDNNNQIGGLLSAEGNTVVNFGGGGSLAGTGVRVQQQYDVLIANNVLNNNNGSNSNHPNTLRGIYCNTAPSANVSINGNTVAVNGGGTSAQVTAIENITGANGQNNSVVIIDNVISNCSYNTATSGSFFGIVNSASAASLTINGNRFLSNTTNASSGSTYLIQNSGQVNSACQISGNDFSFQYCGNNAYTGALSCINISAGSTNANLAISSNTFNNIIFSTNTGSGTINFINNSADFTNFSILNNVWNGINLNNSGSVYCVNNSSSTQSLLTVNANTLSAFYRSVTGNTYFYYGTATSPGTARHVFSNNVLSGIYTSGSGLGNYYGIYDTEGNTSPYPQKSVLSNTITNINQTNAGNFYGLYLSDVGDGGTGQGSQVSGNLINNISGTDNVYGIYIASPVSPLQTFSVSMNVIQNLASSAATGSVFGAWLGTNNAGLMFNQNKISDCIANGSLAAVFGVYVGSTGNFDLGNNVIGNCYAPNATGANRVNGIYINSGTNVRSYYNTVYLNASSSASNFGSNAIYTSTTPTLTLRNNIFINLSVPSGTGISAAYRRSSSTATSYSTSSNNNIFYAGTPGPANVIFASSTSSYQTLSAFQAAFSPRENLSASQSIMFSSLNATAPNFLHVAPNISSAAESGAQNLSTWTNDVDVEIRQGNAGYVGSGTAPDVGADEFEQYIGPCSSVSLGLNTLLQPTICAGQMAIMNLNNFSGGSGFSVQWQSSASSAGPFVNVTGGNGATSSEYTTSALNAGTYFYRVIAACTSNTNIAVSIISSLLVSPTPTLSLSNNNPMQCLGTNTVLNANAPGATQYLWLGPAGFISQLQNPNIAFNYSTAAGNYSVIANQNNCSSTAVVNISLSALNATASADPELICYGQQSTLSVQSSAAIFTWLNASSSVSMAVVTPSANTIYSVVVTNTAGCSMTKTLSVKLITPTISASAVQLCLPQNTGTLSVTAFSPSIVNWFTTPFSNTIIATGATHSISSANSLTLYANAAAVSQKTIVNASTGTIPYSSLMFDLQSQNLVYLNGIDINLNSVAVQTVEVWYRPGSYIGYENSNAGWNYAGFASLPITQAGTFTPIQLPLILPIVPGQTLALCLALNNGSLYCNNSGTPGAQIFANSDLTVYSGNGGNYFSVNNTSVNFQGSLRYLKAACISTMLAVPFNVFAPPTMSVSVSPSITCPGNTTTLSASGAGTYTWSGLTNNTGTVIITPSVNTNFTVSGFSAPGCATSSTLTVGVHSISPISISASTLLVCPQQAITFTAAGANTYTWSAGPNGQIITVNPLVNTTYTVYGSDQNNCINKQQIAVTTKSVPLISVVPNSTFVCPGTILNFIASGALSYTWLPGFYASTAFTAQPFVSSVYNVIGLGVNGCTNVAFANVVVDVCAGLDVLTEINQIKIYPQPANTNLTLELPVANEFKYLIYDFSGQLKYESKNGEQNLDVSNWTRGIYFLVFTQGIKSEVKKIIIE